MHPRIGVGVLILKKNKALFIRRTGSHGAGTWSYPGGHVEFMESPFDTARREVREEVGIDIANMRFLCFTDDRFEQKHYITLFVGADYASGEARICEPGKISDIGWFSLDKLPQPLFPPTANMLSGTCFPAEWRRVLHAAK